MRMLLSLRLLRTSCIAACLAVFVLPAPAAAQRMPAPTSQETYRYFPAASPLPSPYPSSARPIGVGAFANGLDTLDIRVGFMEFSAPVDIYLGIYAPSLNPEILVIRPDSNLQPISQGLVKWRSSVSSSVDQVLFTTIPVNALKQDSYHLYALVTQAGNAGVYYLWDTTVTLSAARPSSRLGAIGQLPQPMAMPPGTVDEAAAALAKAVLGGGENVMPALITAIQAAGITIRNGSEVLVSAAQPTQGFAVNAYQVQAMAALIDLRIAERLGNVGSDLASMAPQVLGDAPLASFLLEGIRDAAQTGSGPRRFWGRFIVELGRQSADPYDMLNHNLGTDIPLDMVQLNLILWRLVADMYVYPGLGGSSSMMLSMVSTPALSSAGNAPCSRTDRETFILDQQAGALTMGFDLLVEYLEGAGLTGAGWAGNASTVTNAALAYVQLFLTHALFTPHVYMESDPPLHRTRSVISNGELRTLVFTARMDTENLQWINCFRQVLNLSGVDFSVPAAGAMQGVDVQWSIDGGAELVVFAPGTDPVHGNITDQQGISKVDIEGRKQKKGLPSWAKQVTKTAAVRASYALTRTSWKDLLNVAWQVPTGQAEILIIVPAELINRTHFPSVLYTFNVQDWAEEVAYKGIVKRLVVDPLFGQRLQETEVNVTFVKDPNQSTPELEAYASYGGTVTRTFYPFHGPGCSSYPESFTDTYQIAVGEVDLWINAVVEPLQYGGSATFSLEKYPLTPLTYQICCSGSCWDQTIEPKAQEHMWWYTGGDWMTAEPDGALRGVYSSPGEGAQYEWNLLPESHD